MTQPTLNFTALFDTFRESMAPFYEAQKEGVKALERLTRYQLAVAGDYVEWSLAQANASVGPKSAADLVGQQIALNTSFGEKIRARAEEFKQIAAETQGTMTKWASEATDKVTTAVRSAA